jgi:sugar phosphate isomerase/epimerase
MRLGGPIYAKFEDAAGWAKAVVDSGYRAAYCPVGPDADDGTVASYAAAADQAGVVIAEVGAWSNPLSPDDAARASAIENCRRQLHLAERIGAKCCVNIAGSRGAKWDGPCALDLTAETFDMIVACVRDIIDAVAPTRTFYALETMPWMYPDTADSYLALVKAIDRKACAVHLDPVNIVSSPQLYFANGALIRECFEKLGPMIKSCHAKDIILRDNLTVHLDEVCPGTGTLDYAVYLRELDALDADIPLMLEHLPNEADYTAAAEYVRRVARQEGVTL